MRVLLNILILFILTGFLSVNSATAFTSPLKKKHNKYLKNSFKRKISSSKNRSKPRKDPPIKVSADHVEQDSAKNIVNASGRVVVRYQGKAVKADKIRINMKTGQGEAVGHVYIYENGIRLKAKRSTFNLKKKTGKIFNVKGKIANDYLIKGKEIDKLSEKHYRLKESSLTTCQGNLPDWLIEVDDMDVKLGDRALFRGGTFKIRDIPIIHLPIGYVPLDNSRKSGFLFPDVGSSNLDGYFVNNSYFWAINEQSDATVYVDYLEKRGVRPGLEYRYTPSRTTSGEFRANILDDNSTGNLFWKVDMLHKQLLPYNFKLDAKLDLVGDDNFDKTFNSNINKRTRRSTDSFALITKSWSNSTLDILTRLRNSIQDERDDVFGFLPKATHRFQRTKLGKTPFYYNHEGSYGIFRTDLNPSITSDQEENIQRADFHPQISMPFRAASWLSINPTIGVRGTYYDKGFDSSNRELEGFFRKSFDINATVEGPRINKVFTTDSNLFPKLNHIIEPRIVYDYIPDMDSEKRSQIIQFDNVDSVTPVNRLTYSINQRLLRKFLGKENGSQADQLLRFEVLQSYDIREARKDLQPGVEKRPFSDIRFDLDSRIFDPFLLNFDGTYNVYDDEMKTTNILLGLKPTDMLTVMFERRWVKDSTTFIQGTLDWKLKKGWRFQYSARYDELTSEFNENDVSLAYNDPCQCWGFGFDFIDRRNINGGLNQNDTRFMFQLNLKGLGSFGTKKDDQLLHRNF